MSRLKLSMPVPRPVGLGLPVLEVLLRTFLRAKNPPLQNPDFGAFELSKIDSKSTQDESKGGREERKRTQDSENGRPAWRTCRNGRRRRYAPGRCAVPCARVGNLACAVAAPVPRASVSVACTSISCLSPAATRLDARDPQHSARKVGVGAVAGRAAGSAAEALNRGR